MIKKQMTRKDNKGRSLKKGESQRNDGRYVYRYVDKFHHNKSIYAKDLRELREKEAKIIHDEYEGFDPLRNKKITINNVFEQWKKQKCGLKTNTLANYIYMYEKFIQKDFGKSVVIDLKRPDIKAFYIHLVEDKNLLPSTIDTIQNVLHQVLELAIDKDIIRANPADRALKELKSNGQFKSEKKKPLSIQEQKVLLNFIKKSDYAKWYPLCYFLLNSGLRIGEALALQWEDIDFDNMLVNVNKTLVYYDKGNIDNERCIYEVHSTKTSNGTRVVPLSNDVLNGFKTLKENQSLFGIKCESLIKNVENNELYDDFIFLNKNNEVMNHCTINRAWDRIRKSCNEDILAKSKVKNPVLVPKFSSHILRHTFCTRMVEAGLDNKTVQKIMGHSDITITMDVYADPSDEVTINKVQGYYDYCNKNGL